MNDGMNQEVLKKNFERHEFETSFFETREQAVNYLQAQIKGRKVAFGGSVTLQEMGLFDALSKKNEVIWHWNEPGAQTLARAREAQIYITSANGVSETGELVNIDGTGNRVAQTLYGPEKVYFVVGKNKIEKDLSSALSRARNVAAPLNAKRLKTDTPCSKTGERCFDCGSEARICRAKIGRAHV